MGGDKGASGAATTDWEAEQKKKRAEDAKSGNKPQAGAPVKTSGWAAVKKGHAMQTTAAAQHGRAITREEMEARDNPKKDVKASTTAGSPEGSKADGGGASEPPGEP